LNDAGDTNAERRHLRREVTSALERIIDRLIDHLQWISSGLVSRNERSVQRLSLQVGQRGVTGRAPQVDGYDETLAPIVFKQSWRPAERGNADSDVSKRSGVKQAAHGTTHRGRTQAEVPSDVGA
jgi:hypothetical protein